VPAGSSGWLQSLACCTPKPTLCRPRRRIRTLEPCSLPPAPRWLITALAMAHGQAAHGRGGHPTSLGVGRSLMGHLDRPITTEHTCPCRPLSLACRTLHAAPGDPPRGPARGRGRRVPLRRADLAPHGPRPRGLRGGGRRRVRRFPGGAAAGGGQRRGVCGCVGLSAGARARSKLGARNGLGGGVSISASCCASQHRGTGRVFSFVWAHTLQHSVLAQAIPTAIPPPPQQQRWGRSPAARAACTRNGARRTVLWSRGAATRTRPTRRRCCPSSCCWRCLEGILLGGLGQRFGCRLWKGTGVANRPALRLLGGRARACRLPPQEDGRLAYAPPLEELQAGVVGVLDSLLAAAGRVEDVAAKVWRPGARPGLRPSAGQGRRAGGAGVNIDGRRPPPLGRREPRARPHFAARPERRRGPAAPAPAPPKAVDPAADKALAALGPGAPEAAAARARAAAAMARAVEGPEELLAALAPLAQELTQVGWLRGFGDWGSQAGRLGLPCSGQGRSPSKAVGHAR
jgi:hypothetical protein